MRALDLDNNNKKKTADRLIKRLKYAHQSFQIWTITRPFPPCNFSPFHKPRGWTVTTLQLLDVKLALTFLLLHNSIFSACGKSYAFYYPNSYNKTTELEHALLFYDSLYITAHFYTHKLKESTAWTEKTCNILHYITYYYYSVITTKSEHRLVKAARNG